MKRIFFCILFSIILFGLVSSETVTYHHKSDSTDEDCFGGTCLSMPIQGPVYATSGNSNWGCGSCEEVNMWIGKDMTQLAKKAECSDGMRNIEGVELCIKTDNGEKWDIVFDIWSGAGSTEFKYTRSSKNNENSDDNDDSDIRYIYEEAPEDTRVDVILEENKIHLEKKQEEDWSLTLILSAIIIVIISLTLFFIKKK